MRRPNYIGWQQKNDQTNPKLIKCYQSELPKLDVIKANADFSKNVFLTSESGFLAVMPNSSLVALNTVMSNGLLLKRKFGNICMTLDKALRPR